MNGVHDMGGMHGHGRVVVERDEPVFHEEWEGRVRGIMGLLRRDGMFSLDEFRHAIERIPPAAYLASSYYERWLAAVELLLEERDFRLPGPVAAAETTAEQRFEPGDRVVVRNRHPHGHTRAPCYARGKSGRVESVHGPWLLPDTNAHRAGLDLEPVYTVVFEASELWGDDAEPGAPVSLDLWQSYLEAASR